MKLLKLIFTTIIFFAFVSSTFVAILYWKANMEQKQLTDEDRKTATGQFIKLSQGISHYEIGGPDTGKVVILIHGFSVPYYIWDDTYNYLVKQGFRVLRYDMYGRGYSDRPDIVYNRAFYETQLLDLIKALKVKTPVGLAGVSFGGAISTVFTCDHPELVDKVILVDPVYPYGPPAQPQFYTLYKEATHPDDRINGQLTDFKYPEQHPDWTAKYRVQMRYKGFRHALVSTDYNFQYNARQNNIALNRLGKPVFLVWGKEDHTVPFTYSDSVRSVLKCEFFPVDDAAHLPQIEKAELVNAKIGSFLKR